MWCYFRQQIIKEKEVSIDVNNRAFLYGDGFFDTCIGQGQHVFLWKNHIERIENAARVFGMELPVTPDIILNIISELSLKNKANKFKAKIVFFRGNGGLYLPSNNKAEMAIFLFPKEEIFEIPKTVLQTAIFQTPLKICNRFSSFKNLSSLPYVMASKWANENGYSDAIILNQNMRLAEFTSSNIFLVNEGQITTPSADEGPILGVMRKFILDHKNHWDMEVKEKKLSSNEVFRSPFLLSTNANGIKVLSLHKQTEIPIYISAFIEKVKAQYLTN